MSGRTRCTVSVETGAQLAAVLGRMRAGDAPRPDRLYLPLSFFLSPPSDVRAEDLRALAAHGVAGNFSAGDHSEIFAALPHVLRGERDGHSADDIEQVIAGASACGGAPGLRADGVLARDLETLALLREADYPGIVEADAGVSLWNRSALAAAGQLCDEWTISPELNVHEIRELLAGGAEVVCGEDVRLSARTAGLVVYGRAPMMVSANCVRRTAGRCGGAGRFATFTEALCDRKGRQLPVAGDCRYCYNVIYNAVPTSLHKYRREILSLGLGRVRIALTTETAAETRAVLALFGGGSADRGSGDTPFETTAGRFKSGVE